jgi:hypothetical protein
MGGTGGGGGLRGVVAAVVVGVMGVGVGVGLGVGVALGQLVICRSMMMTNMMTRSMGMVWVSQVLPLVVLVWVVVQGPIRVLGTAAAQVVAAVAVAVVVAAPAVAVAVAPVAIVKPSGLRHWVRGLACPRVLQVRRRVAVCVCMSAGSCVYVGG